MNYRPPSFKKIFRGFHYGYRLFMNRVDLSGIARGSSSAPHPFDNAAIAEALWARFLLPFVVLLVLFSLSDAGLLSRFFPALFLFVAVVSYPVVSYSLLLRFWRTDHYGLFITSFIWFDLFFTIVFSLLLFLALAINSLLILLILPLFIWRFVVLFRIARNSLGIGGWPAFGLIMVDFIITTLMNSYFSELLLPSL